MIQLIRREMRSLGNLGLIIVACLSLGVAAISMVNGLSNAVRAGIKEQSRPLMGGDVSVRARTPLPELVYKTTFPAVEIREMASMASNKAGISQLVELKAVKGSYPFYGAVETQPQLDDIAATLGTSGVIVEENVLRKLSLNIGDPLYLGGQEFTILAMVTHEPDKMNIALSNGPRVFVSFEGLSRSQLAKFGSRILYKILYKNKNQQEAKQLFSKLTRELKDQPEYTVASATDGQPSVQRGIGNTERFFSLLALLSLMVGGVGIVQSLYSWLQLRQRSIATYRCLGFSRQELLTLYLTICLLLAVIGGILGLIIASAGMYVIGDILPQYVPVQVTTSLDAKAIVQGMAAAILCSMLCAIVPLWRSLRISPLAAMRADVDPPPSSWPLRITMTLGLLLAFSAMVAYQVDSLQIAAIFIGSLLLLFAILLGVVLLLSKLVWKTTRLLPFWTLRQGLSNLRRPGLGLGLSMVGLSLGCMVTLSITLLQVRISSQLGNSFPENAPSFFLVDIQSDQWSGVQDMLSNNKSRYLQSAPVVMARITQIGGESTSQKMSESGENAQWAFRREQRLTYKSTIDPKNLIAGSFGQDPRPEVSVEYRQADRLGIELGDEIVFDIQGYPLTLVVTSLRKVDWESFNINFFFVAEPDVLQDAPQFRIAAAQLDEKKENLLRDQLVQAYPNITLIPIRDIIRRVSSLLEQLSFAVQGLGLFAAVAGVFILIGSIQATAAQRQKQVLLLQSLGASKKEILSIFSMEFFGLGSLAGIIGSIAGAFLAWSLLNWAMRLEGMIALHWVIIWIVAAAIGTTLVSLWSTWRFMQSNP